MEGASTSSAQTYILGDTVSETKLIASLVLFLITLLCGYLPVRMILNQTYVQHALFAGGGVLLATAFCHLIPEAHDSFKLTSWASGHAHAHHHHNHNNQHDAAAEQGNQSTGDIPSHIHVHAIGNLSSNTSTTNNTTNGTLVAQLANNGTQAGDSTSSGLLEMFAGWHVPYVEVTLCCGFFFMYLVEQLMLRFIANHSHEHPCDTAADNTMVMGADGDQFQQQQQQQQRPPLIISAGLQKPQAQIRMGGNAIDADDEFQHNTTTTTGEDHTSVGNSHLGPGGLGQQQTSPASGALANSAASSIGGSTSLGNLSTTIMTPPSLASANSTMRQARQGRRSQTNLGGSRGATELYKFMRGFLIVSAFGMHSIFDGVAIGSQDSIEKVWTVFVAISCHKLIIAAVVGFELFAATLESHLWTLVHLILFSAMSPIGIILIVVAQDALHISSEHPSMILLQSFATGTLLYIIFIEILQPKEDRYHAKNRLGKSFSLIAGFLLMLTVLTLVGDGD